MATSATLVGQQSHVTSSLDGPRQLVLEGRAGTGDPTGQNLPVCGRVLAQEIHILVIDIVNLLNRKAANPDTATKTSSSSLHTLLLSFRRHLGLLGCCLFLSCLFDSSGLNLGVHFPLAPQLAIEVEDQ